MSGWAGGWAGGLRGGPAGKGADGSDPQAAVKHPPDTCKGGRTLSERTSTLGRPHRYLCHGRSSWSRAAATRWRAAALPWTAGRLRGEGGWQVVNGGSQGGSTHACAALPPANSAHLWLAGTASWACSACCPPGRPPPPRAYGAACEKRSAAAGRRSTAAAVSPCRRPPAPPPAWPWPALQGSERQGDQSVCGRMAGAPGHAGARAGAAPEPPAAGPGFLRSIGAAL